LADDSKRLREAIEAHYARVRSRFAFLVNDIATADDLTQEVFARFWETCLAQGYPRDAKAFIGGVERLVFLEHIRGKKKLARVAEIDAEAACDPADVPCNVAERTETFSVLRRLLDRLEPQEQWLIVGRHFFEMNPRELSEVSGIPRRTLVDRYNRAMERLRGLAIQGGLSL
jgi:RNA polymerase sigma factor (sigma-70 family)